ncbi:MAG: UDP-N-acetylmuramoyl-tripeptide--D-alanyl-D-alanine ligase [Lachnospiraceae bacterium]|nr:UDP-N-acetylmuramoyl-tripeptide--D-alanyl-D-alanine ligase [Lachnospiraceae bacterium]
MKNMTLENIAKACGGALYHAESQPEADREASCVVIDSRKMEPGGIFVAAKGERVDGHSFIPAAGQMGALGVVCERHPEDCRVPYILVQDSFTALKEIAEFYRKQLTIPVVGITGSVGKTSTKEFIASVLSRKYRVLKTQGNFNNEVGLPLTVLSIREEHEAAVLEMGISNFGEMHRLSKIARPDICVLTNIGQCHLENLGSREGILRAKSEIFDYMNPEGYVLVNGDDDQLIKITQKGSHAPVRFGLGTANDIFASDVVNKGLLGTQAVIHASGHVFPVQIPLPGGHMVWNALAAAGTGFLMGLTADEVKQGLLDVQAVGGRSHVMELADGILIDDCYNANPVSMKAALDLLATAEGRKTAILGDMFELGTDEEKLHGEIGAYALGKGIDVLVCAGKLARHIYEQVLAQANDRQSTISAYYYPTRDEMMEHLPTILKPGDTILVKASHGMQFEKVVEKIQDGENI